MTTDTQVSVFAAQQSEFKQIAANTQCLSAMTKMLPQSDIVLLPDDSNPVAKLQFVLGRLFLRRLLSQRTQDNRYNHLPIIKSCEGKPYFADDPVEFNLSHTENGLAIITANQGPCGIDIQTIDKQLSFELLAKRLLTNKELACFNNLPPARRATLFLQLFCMKEAYSKLLGKGLKMSFRHIDFSTELMHISNRNKGEFDYLDQWQLHFSWQHYNLVYLYPTGSTVSSNLSSCKSAIEHCLKKQSV
jgi:phosphopantetheine--protein transferase-like protein